MSEPSLEHALRGWRKSFLEHPGYTEEDIEELESHLIGAVNRAVEGGTSPQRAFEDAVRELGTPDFLLQDYLAVQGPGALILTSIQTVSMKYVLPAAIIALSFALGYLLRVPNQSQPTYQIVADADEGSTWRLNTNTGELCRIVSGIGSQIQAESCLPSPEQAANLTLARVSGQVFRHGGEVPAAGARIGLVGEPGTITDRLGRFELATNDYGDRELVAQFDGQLTSSRIVLEEGKHTVKEVELPASPDGRYTIQGRITNLDGSPRRGIPVRAAGLTVATDEEGFYTLRVPGSGEYNVFAGERGTAMYAWTRVRTSGAAVVGADFLVSAGEVGEAVLSSK